MAFTVSGVYLIQNDSNGIGISLIVSSIVVTGKINSYMNCIAINKVLDLQFVCRIYSFRFVPFVRGVQLLSRNEERHHDIIGSE